MPGTSQDPVKTDLFQNVYEVHWGGLEVTLTLVVSFDDSEATALARILLEGTEVENSGTQSQSALATYQTKNISGDLSKQGLRGLKNATLTCEGSGGGPVDAVGALNAEIVVLKQKKEVGRKRTPDFTPGNTVFDFHVDLKTGEVT